LPPLARIRLAPVPAGGVPCYPDLTSFWVGVEQENGTPSMGLDRHRFAEQIRSLSRVDHAAGHRFG